MPLSARSCQTLPAGRHADGRGLYLAVTAKGGRSWIYRYQWGTKRREMGLGSLRDVSLKEAREVRDRWAEVLRSGNDPKAQRELERQRATMPGRSFADVMASAFEARKSGLRDDGKAGRWLSPLNVHVLPRLAGYDIEDINQNDIADTLRPIWTTKPDAARKAMQRLAIVLKHGAARGFEVNLNAAPLARELLGPQGHKVKHIPAMPWAEVPAFYASLGDATASLALRLLILTASRSRPVLYARREHFDLDAGVWTIPAEGEGARMKGNKGKAEEFRIPLGPVALGVVSEAVERVRDGFLFPGQGKGPVISDMSMTALLRRAKLPYRPHGFRSSFRDWVAESKLSEDMAERALAHKVGNAVTLAYRRTDDMDARRVMQAEWERHVTGAAAHDNVVRLSKQ